MNKTLKYILFALLSIGVNLLTQEFISHMYKGEYGFYLSVFCGTLIGLFIKYLLDKKYIFSFTSKNFSQDSFLFFGYTAMGVLTTALFWGVEYLFFILFNEKFFTYVGAVIGLCIGYLIKYYLDKKFIFKSNHE